MYGLYEESTGFLGYTSVTEFLKNAIRSKLRELEPNVDDYNLLPIEIEDIGIRIKYFSKRDLDIQINRIYNKNMNITSTFYNQTSSHVDSASFANELSIKAERMGNDEMVFTQTFEDSVPYDIFDYDADGFVIIDKKENVYDNYIFAEYRATKNYANIGSYALNRQPSAFSVTRKKLTTNLIENIYIVANTEEKNGLGTRLSEDGYRALFSRLSVLNYPYKIEYGVYRPDVQDFDISKAIHMPLQIIAENNSININVQFRRNIIAGWDIQDIEGNKLKQPILYTRDDSANFILPDFQLYFTRGGEVEDSGDYPLITETQAMIDNALTVNELFPIDLDLNDALGYTMAIHVVSEDERAIIGPAFVKYSELINDDNITLKLYKSTKPYVTGMTHIRDEDVLVDGGGYTFPFSQRYVAIGSGTGDTFDYAAIAIEETREIVLGFNGIIQVWFDIQDEIGVIVFVLFNNLESDLVFDSEFTDEAQVYDLYEDSLESDLVFDSEFTDDVTLFYADNLESDVTIESEFTDEPLPINIFEDNLESELVIATDFTDETDRPVEWVDGGSSLTAENTCNNESDVNNTRVKSTSTTYQWVTINSYVASTNESVSGTCSTAGHVGNTRIVCIQEGNDWLCAEQECTAVTTTEYEICKVAGL